MGQSYVGEHANGRLDDLPQLAHLILLGYTGLEYTYLGLLVEQPYRQGYAYL